MSIKITFHNHILGTLGGKKIFQQCVNQDKHLSLIFTFIVIPNNEIECNTYLLKTHNSGINISIPSITYLTVMYKCNCGCSCCYQADIAFQETQIIESVPLK